jgi:outer membrane protein OmpA-like peptidoglycan-associated protein
LLVACGFALVGLGGLPACSPLPDEANPARLIRGTDDAPVPGQSDEFPNLASVPDKPRPASSIEEIKATQASLAAERERARRTDRAVRAGVLGDDMTRLDAIEPLSIGFALGSAALSNENRAALRQLADELSRSGGTARIVGWAGGTDRGADHTLAKARADAVAAELERLGVSPERIVAFAATELELAETAENAAGQRADIFVEP